MLDDFLAPGDVAVIMSNGGFGGIHGKLLDRLRQRTGGIGLT
jgi:UDP-N-acetylmuramate: L-alanyl-gamma-D-glutamyl-meso-diaminopimelate ligase